jgi:Asp-tRNA(Asn)/Glu-tRNA(Gln) amidotransferase B subunit
MREVIDSPTDEKWASQLNPKTEVKNINSFRAVGEAIGFELER